jgi:DNA-binding NtrC family response regulator
MNKKRISLLYLDANKAALEAFDHNMKSHFNIVLASTPIDAYNVLRESHIDLVISAKEIPEMDGISFLETIAKDFPKVGRILCSEEGSWEEMIAAVNRGKVSKILPSPLNYGEIKQSIQDAATQLMVSLEKDHLLEQLERQNQQFEFILRQRLLS